MRGTSGASLAAAQARFEPVLRAAGEGALRIGDELFAVVDALDSSGALRRTLSDPSLPPASKEAVAGGVLAPHFDPRVVDLVRSMASARWSADKDLPDAVERLAIAATLADAEARGTLETVEDEIFRITRALQGQREARRALTDPTSKPERRIALVDALLAGKVDRATAAIARRATAAPRGRRFVASLVTVGGIIAERRERLVATVTSAVELTPAQEERLGSLLERAYGRQVQVYVTQDPAVVGGLRIQIGADVVDNTVLSRLADARRRLAG
ncbi:F0F1 ATP synthase subunit delta [Xylanimonas allomyrinae]|uniref:ATP synthase subunit delta n=1 Tax=Xylanimonas allomyrinae TaxID=2509459 RepID=A0A4V0YE79_9MICO|nr:F0F1 ATP synthase subunit delta [Xylanimonas allomyrinae]QAY63271.1 F0F1 ATP synthase subunit delta [Xylanimonas allomyrinae]